MKKKTDNLIAQLAGALKRKTVTPKAPPRSTKQAVAPAAKACPQKADAAAGATLLHQTVLRVSDALLTHANMCATELTERIQNATGNMRLRVTPNRVLLVALLRWDIVSPQDNLDIVARGSDPAPKERAMWLPRDDTLQKKIQNLQKQFVQRGVHIAKNGANEPAIARQALWRWQGITDADVKFYLSQFQE